MVAAARTVQHLAGLRIAEHGAGSAHQNLRAALVHQISFVGGDRTARRPLTAIADRTRHAFAAARSTTSLGPDERAEQATEKANDRTANPTRSLRGGLVGLESRNDGLAGLRGTCIAPK